MGLILNHPHPGPLPEGEGIVPLPLPRYWIPAFAGMTGGGVLVGWVGELLMI